MDPSNTRKLPRPSSSFRLRNRSLNSLRLRRVFDIFDANRDGVLTIDELLLALKRLGLDADPSELVSAVQSFIKDGRDGLDFEDFQDLHSSLGDEIFGDLSQVNGDEEAAGDEDLKEAFKVFDVNGDGYISAKELQEVLEKLGFEEGAELRRVESMIGCFDRNCDGRVDFGEFKHMMRSFSVKGACA